MIIHISHKTSKNAVLILFFVLLTAYSTKISAQTVQIRLNLFMMNSFYPEDLWNMDITNNSKSPLQVYIKGTIMSNNSKILMELESGRLNLNPGHNVILPMNVTTERTTYYDNDTRSSVTEFMTLPAGSYVFCVQILDVTTNAEHGKTCQEATLEILSPPVLIYPENRSKIPTPYPQFAWLPPLPYKPNASIYFSFRLVEIQSGQSPEKAMNTNPVILTKSKLTDQFLPYTTSYTNLKPGQKYAWQVAAYKGSKFIAETDVWQFVYDSIYAKTPAGTNGSYIVLRNKIDGNSYRVFDGHLRFTYDLISKEVKYLDYKIYSEKAKSYLKNVPKLKVKPGTNYIDLDVSKALSLNLDAGHYILEIQKNKDQKLYTRFYITEKAKQ